MANLNETVTMLQAIARMPQPATTLRDLFFSKTATFTTEEVQIDYKKGGQKLAPYVINGFGRGVNVARDGFKTTTYKPPMSAPQRPLTKDELAQRMMGESIYSTKTPAQRAAEIRAQDLIDLRDMNIRNEEKMVADFLVDRQFTVQGYADDGKVFVAETITFEGDGKLTLTGADAWNQPTAKIMENIREARNFVLRSAPNATKVVGICSENVAQMFFDNEKLMNLLDNRNVTIGNFTPRLTNLPALEYIANFASMEIYSYSAQYDDMTDGTAKPYLPDDYFIVGVVGEGKRLYGAITQLEGPNQWRTYESMYVPKYWADMGQDVEMLRVASRHIIAPEDGNDFFTIKVK